ncbi:SPOR domain-containing protein [Trinickia sp.]|uniref:SPOR domain-containing protein n=1 Tax=Trinickia sp. TaxID=2571163 RepID=UPI003F7E5294
MRFFSFGKKDDTPRRRGASARSARSGGTFEARDERRSRRGERTGDADAMLLDPTLPEKQRARRRLVGAIALVVAAVVVLPMVLDSHPKPVTDDIAIDIPNRPATPPSRAGGDSDDAQDTQAGVAPDRADMSDTAGSGAAAAGVASAPAPEAGQSKAARALAGGAQQANGKQNASKQAPSNASTDKDKSARSNATQSAQSTQSTQSSAKPTAMPAPSAAQADSGTPAAPPGARFAVQLGTFADDASARAWESKLKAAGVPAYIEHSKQANGKPRTMLRAGPFADRAAASAAIAKVREAGLTANAGNAAQ